MTINTLEELLRNKKIDEAISIIEEIGEKKILEAVPFLIEQLENTENHMIRNSIALALSDIGCSQAVQALINVLKHPKTKGYRGTLLAALEPFDYSAHIELLVNFLIEGNFEVSRKSFHLIESIIRDIPYEQKKQFVSKLREEIENSEDKVCFLSEAIELFEN